MLFCVLLHRVGHPGYQEGPEVVYMGDDILSAIYVAYEDYGPTARCATIHARDSDGTYLEPVRVQKP